MGVKGMNIIGVKFKSFGKVYNFINENLELIINDYVIVDTENGEQYAKVCSIDSINDNEINKEEMKKVIRKATKEDYNTLLNNIKDAKEAMEYAKELVEKENIPMRFLDASYTFDKKQLVFNFTADNRIDFRNLVKELAYKYHTRIELRQIGVRDKSKLVGGLGLCGRPLCCSSFLDNSESISINMAKNQGLALNPSKINGLCGRLLCCLAYEDDVYTENRSELPKIGQKLKTYDGEGTVVGLDVLCKKCHVNINGEVKEYDSHGK
jgi:cell fate regulator YaaT (PSP1 superfamily)